MKIIQLEYFLAVVRYNSFTKAAQFLHISQPSLTTSIKKMEADLGYPLFIRTTKELKITEKGIQFYKYAQSLVETYHKTLDRMYDLNISDAPRIKFSILESTSSWIAMVIQQHHHEYETQRYQIVEQHSMETIISSLLNFDVHFALSNEKIERDSIVSVPLYDEPYVLITPKGAIQETEQKADDLQHLPLILPNRQYQVRKHLDEYFKHLNIHPNIVLETDRFEAATTFVHRGLGYTIIPRFYYQSFSANHLNAVKIKPSIERTIYINYLEKRKLSEPANTLIDECIAYWKFQ
ncbi:LysR family transcriptional regulator [Staphylococcus carnosus]|uniref:LysR family transcriptional regulator n=1 Tax=Staphylococcus carnosus TaxID=1281 RepID=A0AAJ0JP25_STACA|nr:LysR family transcriptional regulator [Staphylococcus carnosus]KKB25355.1 LysR family transcriptional regulator [Staphylococcus carnosus]QQS84560.1 LysR family transcriptional regulator [Staphylococcus carnosus]UTB99843.1 LysR family transcriptional regulator [Staphylococcus carnosus]UTC03365.1 LysR family transcriptional regulator [Staphylococcus carnosus]